MERIRISVVRGRHNRAADGFQVCTDGGTGRVDWLHPVTPRRVLLWEDAPASAGHHLDGHLMGRHVISVRLDGYLEGTHLLDERGYPGREVIYETEPFVFARVRFAVLMEDALGNKNDAEAVVAEWVINSAPPGPSDFRPQAQEVGTGRMVFSFSSSARLVG